MSAQIFAGGDPSKVNAAGYAKGDLLAANTVGLLQAMHVGVDTNVLTATSAATLGLSYLAGGSGTGTPITLPDAPTIATDASLGRNFRVTLGGNRILGAPTNPTDGEMVIWEIGQGTGSHTLTLAAGAGGFKFGTDLTSITLSTGANIVDLIGCRYNLAENRWWVIAFLRGF